MPCDALCRSSLMWVSQEGAHKQGISILVEIKWNHLWLGFGCFHPFFIEAQSVPSVARTLHSQADWAGELLHLFLQGNQIQYASICIDMHWGPAFIFRACTLKWSRGQSVLEVAISRFREMRNRIEDKAKEQGGRLSRLLPQPWRSNRSMTDLWLIYDLWWMILDRWWVHSSWHGGLFWCLPLGCLSSWLVPYCIWDWWRQVFWFLRCDRQPQLDSWMSLVAGIHSWRPVGQRFSLGFAWDVRRKPQKEPPGDSEKADCTLTCQKNTAQEKYTVKKWKKYLVEAANANRLHVDGLNIQCWSR